jgi:hypothetical protein
MNGWAHEPKPRPIRAAFTAAVSEKPAASAKRIDTPIYITWEK